ncbi:MAG: hypothetical protein NVSMB23_12770 [Myxococcales bacterium]
MRILATAAVFCSLLGGAWLELTRTMRRPAQVLDGRPRAVAPEAPIALLACAKPAGLRHARGYDRYDLPSLGNAALLSMDRVLVRAGGSGAQPAWRMEIASDSGAGAITNLELAGGRCLAGDGVLAAWPAEDLARAYLQLTPDPAPLDADFKQLD